MTLIVEDGTGIDDANGYVSETAFIAYLTLRGRTPTADSATIETLIIQATDYVEARWILSRVDHDTDPGLSETQGLTLPTATWEINDLFTSAVILYAEHVETLSFYSTQDELGPVKMASSKVGPIEEETQYDTSRSTTNTTYRKIPIADLLMKRFFGISTANQVIRN